MLTQKPKLPAWIDGEIKLLAEFTASHNVYKLRERRANPKGINVDIYFHSAGTDSYYCDVRRRYFQWKEVMEEANQKIACGQYLFTAVIEHPEGVHFVSSLNMQILN